jgi:hypothetical protein
MGMSLSGYRKWEQGDGAGSGEKGARGVTFEQTSRVR